MEGPLDLMWHGSLNSTDHSLRMTALDSLIPMMELVQWNVSVELQVCIGHDQQFL